LPSGFERFGVIFLPNEDLEDGFLGNAYLSWDCRTLCELDPTGCLVSSYKIDEFTVSLLQNRIPVPNLNRERMMQTQLGFAPYRFKVSTHEAQRSKERLFDEPHT
jgi:hypothetical protein